MFLFQDFGGGNRGDKSYRMRAQMVFGKEVILRIGGGGRGGDG